jgi:hypothetical protein
MTIYIESATTVNSFYNSTSSAGYHLIALRDILTTWGWTITYSSDGGTYGSGDNWPTLPVEETYPTPWVPPGSIRWIVFESPLGNELCLHIVGKVVTGKFSYKRTLDQNYDASIAPGATDYYYIDFGAYQGSNQNYTYMPNVAEYEMKVVWDDSNDDLFILWDLDTAGLFIMETEQGSTNDDDNYFVLRYGHQTGTSGYLKLSQVTTPDNVTLVTFMCCPDSAIRGTLFRGSIVYYLVGSTQIHGVMNRDPVDNSVFEFPVFALHQAQGRILNKAKNLRIVSNAATNTSDKLTDQSTGDRYVINEFTIPWDNS